MKDKFELYVENGVLEYWIVDPDKESILIYRFNEKGVYIGSKPFIGDEEIASFVLEGFSFMEVEVFQQIEGHEDISLGKKIVTL